MGFKMVMSVLGHEPAQWVLLLTQGVYLGVNGLDKGCDTAG